MRGHVYLLMSPAFPDLLKIGRTTKTPQERANELSTTGTPDKFVVVYSVLTKDCVLLEQALHEYYQGKRYSPNREFFEVNVADVIRKIDEILDLKNIRINSIDENYSLAVVDVLLYQILIGHSESGYKASRIGILRADKEYEISGRGFTVKCSAEKYLESDDFKSELSNFYKKLGYLQAPIDERIKPILSWFGSGIENIKIRKAKRYRVDEKFWNNAEITISELLHEEEVFKELLMLLPDKLTIYNFPGHIDSFMESIYDPFLWISSAFWDAEREVEKNIEIFEARNAQKNFISLMKDAPKEVVNYWRDFLQKKHGWILGSGEINTQGADYIWIWERYSKMLISDIERTNVINEFKGKF